MPAVDVLFEKVANNRTLVGASEDAHAGILIAMGTVVGFGALLLCIFGAIKCVNRCRERSLYAAFR